MHRLSCPWNKRAMYFNSNDVATSLVKAQTFFSGDQGMSSELVFNLLNNKTGGGAKHPYKGLIHKYLWTMTRRRMVPSPKSPPFFTCHPDVPL